MGEDESPGMSLKTSPGVGLRAKFWEGAQPPGNPVTFTGFPGAGGGVCPGVLNSDANHFPGVSRGGGAGLAS